MGTCETAEDRAREADEAKACWRKALDIPDGRVEGRLDPDVLVIDISVPVLDGLQATSQLHRTEFRTKVVFLTVHEDQDYVDVTMAAGASGYVMKSHLASDLVPPIRRP